MNSLEQQVNEIVSWMQGMVAKAGAKGAVFGLSGGLDSAVVAALCKKAFGQNTLGVIMPCHSCEEDVNHGKLVAETVGIPYYVLDLDNSFNTLQKELNGNLSSDLSIPTGAPTNIKPRLRMTSLYYYAACFNYLVMGTGNKSEIIIGYFTKYGDGGVDLEPLGHLLKEEVKQMAEHLGIPSEIINKPPSAGLWEGQSDEKELGFSYQELDGYLKHGEGEAALQKRIESLIKASRHKRQMPPMPKRDQN